MAAGQRIVIVGGCGRVGLPLGVVLCDAGHTVELVDTDPQRRALVAGGTLPFLENDGENRLRGALATGRLQVSASLDGAAQAEVVIVTVGTPVDEYLNPSLGPFERALDDITARLQDGQLLIIRSTVFPGVTERAQSRLDNAGRKILVAYCPERIAEGHAFAELPVLPQIVSGAHPLAAEKAAALFGTVTKRTIRLPAVEAELAKLFSNAYRYVNFAVANQFYMLASRFGADYNRIADAAKADYPRLQGLARSGFAAGPCLLKDTMQLASFNHHDFPLGQAAMVVNEGLPNFVVDRMRAQFPLSTMTVAILGMAFKGNSDDTRSSLAFKLRKVLDLQARGVLCSDPFIADPSFVTLEQALERADVLVIGAPHDRYRTLTTDKPIIDVFGCTPHGFS